MHICRNKSPLPLLNGIIPPSPRISLLTFIITSSFFSLFIHGLAPSLCPLVVSAHWIALFILRITTYKSPTRSVYSRFCDVFLLYHALAYIHTLIVLYLTNNTPKKDWKANKHHDWLSNCKRLHASLMVSNSSWNKCSYYHHPIHCLTGHSYIWIDDNARLFP